MTGKSESPYNPLDKKNLGDSVADALLLKEVFPLSPGESFRGAGIYAIYYVGKHPLYKRLAVRNMNAQFNAPIYVGKAVPAGARKGGFGLDCPVGSVLYKRLREHAESIQQVSNLDISDFFCRYLVVDDIWIPLGESLLIEKFKPVWNMIVDGFGNHDPGKGRREQQCSPWDVLHPGRTWAGRLNENSRTETQITNDVMTFFDQVIK